MAYSICQFVWDVGFSCVSAAELATAWMLLGAFPHAAHLWLESSQASWEGSLCVGCSVPHAALCWRTDLVSFYGLEALASLTNSAVKSGLLVRACLCSCMCTHRLSRGHQPNSSPTFRDADTHGV